jgi:hypothetical protein
VFRNSRENKQVLVQFNAKYWDYAKSLRPNNSEKALPDGIFAD